MASLILSPEKMMAPPGGPIPLPDAERLVRNHKNSSNLTKDCVYIYFSFEELRDYMLTMEDIDGDASGLRIYLGRHDATATGSYKDRQTVVLVATKTDDDGCITEMLEDNNPETDPPSYDFGTLCPPNCSCECENEDSIAFRIYGRNTLCP